MEMPAIAVTDHGVMFGALDFYEAARAHGIKPILGVEAYVSPRGMADKVGREDRNYFHLVLLAKDRDGYQNLIKLVSRANLDGYYYKPRFDRALLAEHAHGLIALSACYSGEPNRAVLEGDMAKAREAAGWYRQVFGDDYFLELQDHGNDDDRIVNRGLLELHKQLGIPSSLPTTRTMPCKVRRRLRTFCCASRPTACSRTRGACACSPPSST